MSQDEKLITPAQKQALQNILENVKYGGTASTMITLLTNSQLLKTIGVGDIDNATTLLTVQMRIVQQQKEAFKASLIPA